MLLAADEAARATSGGSVMVRDPLETSWHSAGTDRFDNEIEKAVGSVSKGESRAPSTAISGSPGELSTTLFDRLRAASVVLGTGIKTLTTEADSVTYPTLTADVAPAWTSEAAAITPGPDALDRGRNAAQVGGPDPGVERGPRGLRPAARQGPDRPPHEGALAQARRGHPRGHGHPARAHGTQERLGQADARGRDERRVANLRQLRGCHRASRGGQRAKGADADRGASAQHLDAAEGQGQHRWQLPLARRRERRARHHWLYYDAKERSPSVERAIPLGDRSTYERLIAGSGGRVWLIAAALKAAGRYDTARGFESLPLRSVSRLRCLTGRGPRHSGDPDRAVRPRTCFVAAASLEGTSKSLALAAGTCFDVMLIIKPRSTALPPLLARSRLARRSREPALELGEPVARRTGRRRAEQLGDRDAREAAAAERPHDWTDRRDGLRPVSTRVVHGDDAAGANTLRGAHERLPTGAPPIARLDRVENPELAGGRHGARRAGVPGHAGWPEETRPEARRALKRRCRQRHLAALGGRIEAAHRHVRPAVASELHTGVAHEPHVRRASRHLASDYEERRARAGAPQLAQDRGGVRAGSVVEDQSDLPPRAGRG